VSADSATIAGRIAAETLMRDTCAVTRATGATAIDPVTLAEVPVTEAVWSGACRIQRSGALSPREVSGAAGYEFGIDSVLAQLPIDATGIRRGDVLEVTAVGDVTDPDVLGIKATVQANLAKSHATKRTLICEEVS
jgi:hypothetical protein